jgi:sugar phosphate isomerase/epimerase
MSDSTGGRDVKIGLFTEPFAHRPLGEVLDWLVEKVPQVKHLEVGTGGYAPVGHCDLRTLLGDAQARARYVDEFTRRGLRLAALNVSGNPLHPDRSIGRAHDAALRDTIRLAALLDVDRIVAMAGCPEAPDSRTRTPHFATTAWLPDFLGVADWQWEHRLLPYWSEISAFAAAEHPDLLICFELHPGTAAYNVDTFSRLAGAGPNVAVNLDPSHFFWQSIDPLAVIETLGNRIAHCHAKDVVFNREQLALNGVLDNRWPGPPEQMAWNFATVGRGHDVDWWTSFIRALLRAGFRGTLSIECEDPFVSPEHSAEEAADVLGRASALAGVPASGGS